MLTEITFFHPRWPVFYEDNHLLVLFKPAGLLVQGDASGAICLLELAKLWLKERHHKPGRVFLGLVHRLDRPVAGVMLFARTSKAAARLSAQFRTGKIRKIYLAVVEGRPERSCSHLHQHMVRSGRSSRIVEEPTNRSRQARLTYQVLASSGGRSLLRVELETGRRHQIRLQLSHAGHPVVGDVRYGAANPLQARQIALLASELTLEHPTRKVALHFGCPPPLGWPWPSPASNRSGPSWNWDDLEPGLDRRITNALT